MEHDRHRCSGAGTLVPLLGTEDSPLCTLVDDFLLENQSTIIANDLPP